MIQSWYEVANSINPATEGMNMTDYFSVIGVVGAAFEAIRAELGL